MAKKKKKELNPQITEVGDQGSSEELKQIALDIEKSTDINTFNQGDSSETFFKNVVGKLFDDKNISAKTEYIGVRENFMGSKLTFLSKHCNLPFLEQFINVFEEKRISLDRKGRKEILMALQERRQEQQAQQFNQMRGMFGL